jgi:spermidine synthase
MMETRQRVFAGCYAASGAAALVYEVAWTRLLTLQLGHTAAAVSTVLAAFMGGLAAGAWLAARWPVPPRRRLYAYASLELVVALIAIALPLMLRALVPALEWAYADGDAPTRFGLVRVALTLSLLAVPAVAMGATFPIAAGWFAAAPSSADGDNRRAAAAPAILYAANTTGAAVGAIGAGFWLIPAVGLRGTTWVGVALNVAAAFGALALSRAKPLPMSESPRATASRVRARGSMRRRHREAEPVFVSQPWLAFGAVALSGFGGLVYEVALTRVLAAVIGPTTYAFATMAASFISGIAIGSWAGTRLARRVAWPACWLAGLLLLAAASASAAASFAASRLPLIVASQVRAAGAAFHTVVIWQALEIVLLLLPLTVALGMTFPIALATASSGSAEAVERDTARIYVANTLGAISGSLMAGFVLIPHLGLQGTFVGMSRAGVIGGFLVAGVALVPRVVGTAARLGATIALATLAALMALAVDIPQWDRDLLSSGAYKYAPYIAAAAGVDFEASLRAGRLEYYAEGAAATVSVRRLAGTLALAIDGKVDASNAGDMLTQRLLGVLPTLLHANPRELCIIGLGSGVTLGSALATGLVRHADVIEISPEVVEASALFSKENGRALQSPAVHLVIGDGRSHLQLTRHRYDVIVSEPSNPWMAGVAALFTREFFEAARAHLNPGGLLCQWAHTYDMSADDLRSIVRTFASVFPQGTMWLVGDGDLLLIGAGGGDIVDRLALIAEPSRAAAIGAALADVAVTPGDAPFQLLSLFSGGPAELARYADDAPLQTDDRMALEFSAPRLIYGRSVNGNTAQIRALTGEGRLPVAVATILRTAGAPRWKALGAMQLKAQAYSAAYGAFREAVARDDRDLDALKGVSEAAGGANRQAEERAWLEDLARAAPSNAAVRVELSHVRAAAHDYDQALAAASDALRLQSADPRALEQLASVLADMGDGARLETVADRLLKEFPERPESRYYLATARLLRGRTADAAAEARRLLAEHPNHAKAQNLLGVACANAAQHACAVSAFEAAIRLSPRDSSAYVNLGLLYLQTGESIAAAGYFAEALAVDPGSEAARGGLAQAQTARSAGK